MRVLLQRVSRAGVSVDGQVVSSIGKGFCLLVGVGHDDGEKEVAAAVDKIAGLRVFSDAEGKMNLGIGDVGGEILVVSQFTLLGDVRKGRRPSFTPAARPEHAEPLIESMVEEFEAAGIVTRTGVFGAMMEVELVNDGPVTLILEVSDGRVQ
ncbi:MAG: D-aminoacyl-tRNA deacylase [Actinomycetota bacterium]